MNTRLMAIMAAISIIAVVLSLMMGAQAFTPIDLWRLSQGEGELLQWILFWELRLPRTLLALLVGASLATAGGLMQGVTRNPLAAPDLTGVVAGAACMVVILSTLASVDAAWYPLAGVAGGAFVGALTFVIAWKNGLMPVRVVLAGVAMSSMCVAVMTGLLVFSGAEAGELFFWLAGGISGRGWAQLAQVIIWTGPPLLLAMLLVRWFRVLLLDDAVGRSLGISVSRWRLMFMLLAVVMTAGAVTVAGPVGFIGLVVPHISRQLLSDQSAAWLPLNAALGGLLLLWADLMARLPATAQEVPLGVVTALLGGPWLLLLMHKNIRRAE